MKPLALTQILEVIICLQLFVVKLLICIESVPVSLFGIGSVAGAVVADNDADDDDDDGNGMGFFDESTQSCP